MNKIHSGKTKLETILVMLLLVIFCISTYTLIVATSSYYNKSQKEVSAKNSLRLASSYIDSRIKQSDSQNIKILNNIMDIKQALVIEETINSDTYQTLLYKKNNSLRELFIKKGTILENTDGSQIAQIHDMTMDINDNGILNINISTKANSTIYKTDALIKVK